MHKKTAKAESALRFALCNQNKMTHNLAAQYNRILPGRQAYLMETIGRDGGHKKTGSSIGPETVSTVLMKRESKSLDIYPDFDYPLF